MPVKTLEFSLRDDNDWQTLYMLYLPILKRKKHEQVKLIITIYLNYTY